MERILVTRITIFPVKSLRGISLERARLTRRGLEGDRRYMLVDADGRFFSQRECAELARFETEAIDAGWRIRHVSHSPLEIPRAPDGGELVPVSVWGSELEARVHPAGSAYFRAALGRDLSLVYMSEEIERPVNPARGEAGDIVSFADGYPVLLANEGSLASLNRELGRPVGLERFRANVVVAGAEAWVEERWARLRVGDAGFRVPKACERCSVINVDPATATRESEPLKTLTRVHAPAGYPLFGVNLIPEGTSVGRTIALGDEVAPV